MPTTTNKHGLPEAFENFNKKNTHSAAGADITVTGLIDSPQIFRLRREHAEARTEDVSELIPALIGTAVHRILEEGAPDHHIVEQRFHVVVDGIKISGAADVQIPDEFGAVEINDWKTCSASALSFNPDGKVEWEQQLNCYAAMARLNGVAVRSLKVTAIVKDWSAAQKIRYKVYPELPVVVLDIPLWSEEEGYAYLEERVKAHKGGSNTRCSDRERWVKDTKHAVMKKDRKSAVRVFDTEAEAKEFLDGISRNFPIKQDKPQYWIEERGGEATRCAGNYCGIRDFCPQYKENNL